MIDVVAGTAPTAPVPLVLARLAKAGGTAIVKGLMNVQKRTLAAVCW